MPKRVIRRRRIGKGFGDFLQSALGGLGGGLGNGVRNLLSGVFGGGAKRKPRRTIKRRRGPVAKPKKRSYRKKRGGAGEMAEAPSSLLGRLNKLAKDTQIVSKAAKEFGPGWVADAASRLGYGRKKRTTRRKYGGMSTTMNHVMPYTFSNLTL